MIDIKTARKLRALIEKAVLSLDDEDALECVTLFTAWDGNGHVYAVGDRVRYGEHLYDCLQAHTSQEGWNPVDAASLWAKVLIPGPGIPEWEQPSSTNPYMKDDKVRHIGKVWISLIDNNVWEPGAVGTESLWAEVME